MVQLLPTLFRASPWVTGAFRATQLLQTHFAKYLGLKTMAMQGVYAIHSSDPLYTFGHPHAYYIKTTNGFNLTTRTNSTGVQFFCSYLLRSVFKCESIHSIVICRPDVATARSAVSRVQAMTAWARRQRNFLWENSRRLIWKAKASRLRRIWVLGEI